MSAAAGPKKIVKDQYLFREGDAPDAMYVIKSGKLAVLKSKQSSEIVLAEIGPGAMVGEMAFFDNKPRSASVKALRDSEVIALPYKALHAQFKSFPEWCKAIMRTVNDSLRNANQKIKQLETGDSETELFPAHTITKLIAILNFVGLRYGKNSPEDKGLVLNGVLLRNITIQVFQEATHKMQKLLNVLMELNLTKVEDLGEGRQKIVIINPELLFAFVDWHYDWIYKKEEDRITLKEEQIKILKGVLHFAKKTPPNDKGFTKVRLSDLQSNSLAELGYAVKVEETLSLVESQFMGEHTVDGDAGISSLIQVEEVSRVIPFWEIIYALGKLKR